MKKKIFLFVEYIHHDYLENKISEHRSYNRNWKNELVIQEQEEAARQIAEADLSDLVEQEEIVDEIIEVDLGDLEEQEEVVHVD